MTIDLIGAIVWSLAFMTSSYGYLKNLKENKST